MTTTHVSGYTIPQQWLRYDVAAIAGLLVEAKTAAGVLKQMPSAASANHPAMAELSGLLSRRH